MAHQLLNEIRGLDPVRDHQRVIFLSSRCEFPFDTTRALELALFRTFCVPSISALLDRTGEFQNRAQKRYDDTDLIVSELIEHGYDSPRGAAALRRMNQIHGRFAISNQDFLYVLSTFIYEPIRWNERFGWRPMIEQERLAQFYFWREVGRRMAIRDLPEDYARFEQFNREYERDYFHYTAANERVGKATLEMFAGWFIAPLRPLVRQTIYGLLDDTLLTGFGFPRPWPGVRTMVATSLRLRALALRCWPFGGRPRLRTEMRHPSYPDGYQIEQLGPPAS